MRVKIRDITRAGLDVIDQAMPAELDLLEDFINPEKPIVVQGRFQRVDDFVIAKVKVTYVADTVCARCLDPIEGEVAIPLDLDVEVTPGVEFIDLGARVREEVLMAYVPGTLCRPDCKGICQGCGAYLNTEPCECDKPKKE
ncbi:MAG: DUF177 domain-containing protein [Elusimicrobia bacterium]|nr:DUF177 domain-containing protein [Elusimicrobiota bacterium]